MGQYPPYTESIKTERVFEMTIREAEAICRAFSRRSTPTEDDAFLYVEAMDFLIRETARPEYMMELGGWYYGQKKFDLALKYYDLAAEYRWPAAYLCLGYIWYYGRTGKRDYEKAFRNYSLAAESGSTVARYKLADMYKNGYHVEKDYGTYKAMVEALYPDVKDAQYTDEPLPEVYTRLARIREEEGRPDDALALLQEAKPFLAQRIRYSGFFGDLSIMKGLIEHMYTLTEPDPDDLDLYDLYELLRSPCRVGFYCGSKPYTVERVQEGEESYIRFGNKFFRGRDDFFSKAKIGGERITALDNLYGFEVL